MNKLTIEEFHLRTQEVLWSDEIFIKTGLTKNISKAYEAYCKVFDKRLELLTTEGAGRRQPAALDNLNRPTCPVCGKSKMLFRSIPPGQKNKVQLLCEAPTCDTVLNSLDDMKVWIGRMKETASIDLSGLERVSKRDPIPGRKYTWLSDPCPKCNGRIYEMDKCCGAPEGLIECSNCDWTMLPSEFHKE